MNRRDFLRMIGLGCLVSVLPKMKRKKIPEQCTVVYTTKELLSNSVVTREDCLKLLQRPWSQRPVIVWGDWYDIEEDT